MVSEAFHVLSDPGRRAVYDQYGFDGLKNGVTGLTKPYQFNIDPLDLYTTVFGSPAPAANLHAGSSLKVRGPVDGQCEPIILQLPVTLEELYHSVTKQVEFTRTVLSPEDSRTKHLAIPLQRGWIPGGRIRFPGQGSQTHPRMLPGDVVVELTLVPHKIYTLHPSFDISCPRARALTSLGGRRHTPAGPRVPGRGLFKDASLRGDLILE